MGEDKRQQAEKDEQIETVTEVNEEAWDVIKRLYDGTFKELVER
ncbi:hypothetical protein [Rossellomorea marisflavi]